MTKGRASRPRHHAAAWLASACSLQLGVSSCSAAGDSPAGEDGVPIDATAPGDVSGNPGPEADRGQGSTIVIPLPDSWADACDRNVEVSWEGVACHSPRTGCPSHLECFQGSTYCLCFDCEIPLPPGDCSWHLEGEDLIPQAADAGLFTLIKRIGTEGGLPMSELSLQPSLDACGSSAGWYYRFSDPTHLEIALCPASCDEQQTGAFRFVVYRSGCPIT
jgi:hypothetical protein